MGNSDANWPVEMFPPPDCNGLPFNNLRKPKSLVQPSVLNVCRKFPFI